MNRDFYDKVISMRYSIGEFSELVGVTTQTLRVWDKEGLLPATKSPKGTRYYSDEDYQKVLRRNIADKPKKNVIYCRVSSPSQKDDLKSQVSAMETFTLGRGMVTETITEVGGGMNFSRPKFMQIVTGIIKGNIGCLVVAHKDRLARFGFELVENLAKTYGCEIIVVNREELSPQQEMVEDLMSIIHTFSCRLYGLRKYKKAKDLIKDE
jgi:predicted site-specific integrase-resolvase